MFSSSNMASICCPIEMEPRTLSQGQLNLAREVAADVAQKMEPKEASTVFIEGLRPVLSVKDMTKQKEYIQTGEALTDENIINVENPKKQNQITEMPCQCACPHNVLMESPDHQFEVVTEPLSAAF